MTKKLLTMQQNTHKYHKILGKKNITQNITKKSQEPQTRGKIHPGGTALGVALLQQGPQRGGQGGRWHRSGQLRGEGGLGAGGQALQQRGEDRPQGRAQRGNDTGM